MQGGCWRRGERRVGEGVVGAGKGTEDWYIDPCDLTLCRMNSKCTVYVYLPIVSHTHSGITYMDFHSRFYAHKLMRGIFLFCP